MRVFNYIMLLETDLFRNQLRRRRLMSSTFRVNIAVINQKTSKRHPPQHITDGIKLIVCNSST